jgi:hypothetical protein
MKNIFESIANPGSEVFHPEEFLTWLDVSMWSRFAPPPGAVADPVADYPPFLDDPRFPEAYKLYYQWKARRWASKHDVYGDWMEVTYDDFIEGWFYDIERGNTFDRLLEFYQFAKQPEGAAGEPFVVDINSLMEWFEHHFGDATEETRQKKLIEFENFFADNKGYYKGKRDPEAKGLDFYAYTNGTMSTHWNVTLIEEAARGVDWKSTWATFDAIANKPRAKSFNKGQLYAWIARSESEKDFFGGVTVKGVTRALYTFYDAAWDIANGNHDENVDRDEFRYAAQIVHDNEISIEKYAAEFALLMNTYGVITYEEA